jgi:hypothetical protein
VRAAQTSLLAGQLALARRGEVRLSRRLVHVAYAGVEDAIEEAGRFGGCE